MITATVVLALFSLLVWLLFSPIELRIDTKQQLYFLRWRFVARVDLLPLTNDLGFQLRIGPWRRRFFPLQAGTEKKSQVEKASKVKPAPKKKSRRRVPWRLIRRILRSFRIKALHLDLDTGDYVRNAYLFPVGHLLRTEKAGLQINFEGRTDLEIWIQNRGIRILVAALKEFFNRKTTIR